MRAVDIIKLAESDLLRLKSGEMVTQQEFTRRWRAAGKHKRTLPGTDPVTLVRDKKTGKLLDAKPIPKPTPTNPSSLVGKVIGPIPGTGIPMEHPDKMLATKASRRYYGKYHPFVKEVSERLGDKPGLVERAAGSAKNITTKLLRSVLG